MQETEPELEKNEETEERCEGQDFKKKIKGGQRKKNQNSHWRSYVVFLLQSAKLYSCLK